MRSLSARLGPTSESGVIFAEFLLEMSGLDRPIDAGSDIGKGDFKQGSGDRVECVLPGTVVIERIGHFPVIRSDPTGTFRRFIARPAGGSFDGCHDVARCPHQATSRLGLGGNAGSGNRAYRVTPYV